MSIWAHPAQVAGRHAGAGEEHGLTDAGPRPPAFEHAGLETGLLRLRCVTPGRLEAPLIAWLGGMEAGRAGLPEGSVEFQPGDPLTLRIGRLPCAAPGEMLRFACPGGGGDLVPPLALADGRVAWALLGPGEPTVEALEARQGVLHGRLVNAVNGLFAPPLSARVNGALPRAIVAEPPRPRPDGASVIRFALSLRPEEIGEAGLSVEIRAEGVEAPLARWALAPVVLQEAETLAGLAARLRRLEQASTLRDARLRLDLDHGFATRDARFEAFVEHVVGLIAGGGPEGGRIAAPDDRIEGLLTPLRALLDEAMPPPAVLPAERRLGPGDGAFTLGWHPPEEAFRWMGPSGMVENPDPWRPVRAVRLRVAQVYGSDRPRLLASLDARHAPLRLQPVEGGTEVLIVPEEALAFDVLRLDSLTHGSPAREGRGDDTRELSLAVAEVVFVYAGDGGGP
ncbi:Hypothetical protein HVIM_02139 [Roseomonas mucosa]|uniref:Uncharacterized protein n=1 Tax=Roseomonas mucosa TaxID=207340 RepID=A0A379N3P0_9PROT|nr:Hypothetical protein HVIM_02139 [Roseomonas mucosa]QDE00772.1 Hypothetical protein ADP8_02139 [Roseomonas mucosa]UZO93062.1 Hypothetical protein RMP42_02139 [Roseomonas mucosa]SUE41987.1 Uncharacterised protein [Roseomonas mucosa]